MELEKIFKLIDAGYTKEEIQAFESQPAADPEPEKETEAPEAKEAPAAKEEPAPATAAASNNDKVLQALNRLTDAIMKKNLNVTTAETTQQDPKDILAKVIAPPKKEI